MADEQSISLKASSRFDVTTGTDMEAIAKNAAYVLPTPAPNGIGGFVFNIVTDDSVELVSEITDHYTENNLAFQDHIAIAPEKVTVTGFVGEIEVSRGTIEAEQFKQMDMLPVPDEISPLSPFYEGEEPTNYFATCAIKQLADNSIKNYRARLPSASSANSKQTIWDYYKSKKPKDPSMGNQEYAFGFFQMAQRSRMLFTVETPWGTFTKMAIERVKVSQGDATRYVSEFSITFKRIRTANDVAITVANLMGRAAQQASEPQNSGNVQGGEIARPGDKTAYTGATAPTATPSGGQVKMPMKTNETPTPATVRTPLAIRALTLPVF